MYACRCKPSERHIQSATETACGTHSLRVAGIKHIPRTEDKKGYARMTFIMARSCLVQSELVLTLFINFDEFHVCQMFWCAKIMLGHHACWQCCQEFVNSKKHDEVLVRQPRAQSGSVKMHCLFAILLAIQDLSLS